MHKPSPTIIKLQTVEECGKTYQQQIAPYMRLDQKERHKGSDYEKVELFWPHELLQVHTYMQRVPKIHPLPADSLSKSKT